MTQKRLVTVVKTVELIIELPDELLTPEAISEFEEGMFGLDGNPDKLFAYVGEQIVDYPGYCVEGVGYPGTDFACRERYGDFETTVEEVNE